MTIIFSTRGSGRKLRLTSSYRRSTTGEYVSLVWVEGSRGLGGSVSILSGVGTSTNSGLVVISSTNADSRGSCQLKNIDRRKRFCSILCDKMYECIGKL